MWGICVIEYEPLKIGPKSPILVRFPCRCCLRAFRCAVGLGLRMTQCVCEVYMSRIGGGGSDVMGTHEVMMVMRRE